MIDVSKIKKDFPIFEHNPRLVYLDSTATSLKPKQVIEALDLYYKQFSANIYRGVYEISEKATKEYEATRAIVADFIHAKPEEIVFTRNTTESLNLVAYALGRIMVDKNDEIVTTVAEHHSNFVPWQVLAREVGTVFKVIDITNNGDLDICVNKVKSQKSKLKTTGQKLKINLESIITKKTKILAITHISNVLGIVNPIKEIIRAAKEINPRLIVVVDGAQAIPHIKVNLRELGCDFYAFSSHKMFGPTGVGVLWGRYELLSRMSPFNFGGEMIREVHIEKTIFKDPPQKFEAGTPHIAGVIAMKEAVRYLKKIGLETVHTHERSLVQYAAKTLKAEFKKEISIIVPEHNQKSGILAFNLRSYHPHDIAQILDENNICIRAGHHCAMPLHKRLALQATARASFYLYNTKEDIDRLVEGLQKVKSVLQ